MYMYEHPSVHRVDNGGRQHSGRNNFHMRGSLLKHTYIPLGRLFDSEVE